MRAQTIKFLFCRPVRHQQAGAGGADFINPPNFINPLILLTSDIFEIIVFLPLFSLFLAAVGRQFLPTKIDFIKEILTKLNSARVRPDPSWNADTSIGAILYKPYIGFGEAGGGRRLSLLKP